nr:peptidylprolyl isomerase [Palleniella muris]
MILLPLAAQSENDGRTRIVIETTLGNIKVALYDETPLHSENFKSLVDRGFYDGLLFHRVINKFMIQAGDSTSRSAAPGGLLGDTSEPYTVPAEIRFPNLLHKRGALCMAREGDATNPQRVSSAYQFYIVYGTRFNDDMLDKVQARLDAYTGGKVVLTPEAREVYKRIGGTPHLDGQYTVFGEVIEGIDIVRDIQWVDTDANDRPVKDVRIIKAYTLEAE